MRWRLLPGLPPLLVLATGALAGDAEIPVAQRDRAFSVAELAVPRGTVLRFSNEDEFPQQINARGPEVEMGSDLQAPGEILRLPLPAAGRVEIRCGIHLMVNRRFAEMFGAPAPGAAPGEMFAAEGLAVLLPPPGTPAMSALTFTAQLPDERWISVVHRPVEGGGWVATCEDVTERKHAEARLA
ncbi:PAS-domain containing protein [Roseomonas sp. E05]|uniref:PAS-domain containing protein n=1 Tax=Roseomonas sp. E05 TaxID=3046310 RepID=UPI0024BB5233|nr:PAS-domain containing protein [Roseomonas sp. E05]MDJ0389988.1 PAS-domain containing protein [Roseomonas sp. E05]